MRRYGENAWGQISIFHFLQFCNPFRKKMENRDLTPTP